MCYNSEAAVKACSKFARQVFLMEKINKTKLEYKLQFHLLYVVGGRNAFKICRIPNYQSFFII